MGGTMTNGWVGVSDITYSGNRDYNWIIGSTQTDRQNVPSV